MPQKTCATCDGPVAAAGRKSKTGVYYCSKIDCRRERDRLRAQRWREQHAPEPIPARPSVAVQIAIEHSRRAEAEKLRAILLEGGLTQEEVDVQVPLPA